jgi:hypothetical protein
MAKSRSDKDKQMLAEALNTAFGLAQKLGIELGNNLNVVDSNMIVVPKSRPELKSEKVAHYTYLLSTGKRQTKAELMKRIL